MSLSCDGTSYDRTRDEHSWIAVIGFRLIGCRFSLLQRDDCEHWSGEKKYCSRMKPEDLGLC